jgi:signal transduction histidine kinase
MPFASAQTDDPVAEKTVHGEQTRYRRLWWYSVILMALVSLTPLVIQTFVNIHQAQKAIREEMRFPITRLLSNTKKALEFVIAERKSALRLVISEKTYEELANDEGLAQAFNNLKESFGGFVDLGLVDAEGNQNFYIGPYDLKGKNYRDQAWLHEVRLRDVYVSDVFMGFRNFPHFIIAVKQSSARGGFYVLRATIDMHLLNQQITALDLGPSSDVFIVNADGILQTNSRFHGKILEPCTIPLPKYSDTEMIQEFTEKGQSFLLGYAFIEKSPFILMIIQNQKDLMPNWLSRRQDPLWFLAGSSILILLVVLGVSTYTVRRIRSADIRRAKAFHNLEYTNKMASIGRLAASVAHEINNPIAIINEKAGLLKDMASLTPDFTQREKVLKLLDSIHNSVERVSTITHRLLGFSRRMNAHMELIDLPSLLKEVLSFLGKELSHRNITITFEVPDSFPAVESDRGQLQQVFLNIINNAIAAIKEGGWIRFTLEEVEAGGVAVKICDNGTGISPEDLKHIFEPFFSTKGEFGTGLGLSITYDIIKKLGGDIQVESQLGKGTCFTILLPRQKA